MDELIGKTVGAYTIVEKIGEGGMAIVFKGYQKSLNRYVAIKILREELAHDPEFINRFRREALAIANLNHPNILHVYDAGVAYGHYYLVMDYAEGGSLQDLLRRGPLDVGRTISIISQLADALDHAHQRGLVHRDVKPSNVMLTREGHPLLTDFGIAKVLYETTSLTRTGAALGTPDYMAPEQIQGQPVDGRTDIYALGIMLYEMLAGWAPFRSSTPVATLYRQVNEPPPPLHQANIAIPPWLDAVVGKALAKQPAARYQRASELAQDLRRQTVTVAPGGMPPSARTVPPPVPSVPTVAASRPAARGRSPLLLWLGALAVLLLAVVVVASYMLLREEGLGWLQASSTPVVIVIPPQPTEPLLPTQAVEPSPMPPTTVSLPTATPPTPVPTRPPTVQPTQAPTLPPPTAAPTRPPTSTPVREPGLITGFEEFGTWKRGDQPNGTFTQSRDLVHRGNYSGRLEYDFPTSGNDFVVFQQVHAIAGQPATISAWVYGDGAGHFFNVWIKDADGQVWQVPLGTVTHSGWAQMVGKLDPGQPWPFAHISGPDNGTIDYPISFAAVVLDDRPDPFIGQGTIYLDDLRAETGEAVNPSAPGEAGSPTSAPAARLEVLGKIAFSAGGALYVVAAATGQQLAAPIAHMRQPDLRNDGQVIIVNGEGGGKDSLWTAWPGGGLDREQSTHPDDYHPFFSPSDPGRFVYDSTMMGKGHHNLFIGHLNNRRENRDPLSFGGGPIIGSHPIWLADDQLVYTGCDYGFGNGANCGLFKVPSWGGEPVRILPGSLNDLASDSHGSLILFTSQRDGNWEVYLIRSDGSGLRNLSNSPTSNDGLGTFSPDGKLVAFVSNRDGQWAVWAVRTDGSNPTRLFTLPAPPTGPWTDERISWGP
ncbi:MAG: protein kinase domain-containing protein [Anaerolineae bacterium]